MPNYADFKLGNLPKRSYFRQTPAIADFGEAWWGPNMLRKEFRFQIRPLGKFHFQPNHLIPLSNHGLFIQGVCDSSLKAGATYSE